MLAQAPRLSTLLTCSLLATLLAPNGLGQGSTLKASTPGSQDQLGWSVSISGNTLVAGAPFESSDATGVDGDEANDLAPESGAVYVYVRSGLMWTQQAYLKASNTDAGDHFGESVSISGDTLVVGSPDEASIATGVGGDESSNSRAQSGAAYIFVRTGSVWTQEAYLKASNSDAGDEFGNSVSVSGDTLIVAAHLERSNSQLVNGDEANNAFVETGAAYIFTRSGTTWSQEAYLKSANSNAGDLFGTSVGLSGDSAIVGARGESGAFSGTGPDPSSNVHPHAGAAYIFHRAGSTWSQQAYLKHLGTNPQEWFGYAVAIDGDLCAIGTPGENFEGERKGAAYTFVRSGTTWSEQDRLVASNPDGNDRFAESISLSGDRVLVGAFKEDGAGTGLNSDGSTNFLSDAGAAYVFDRFGTVWVESTYVKANYGEPAHQVGAHFGYAVAISGSDLVIGAPRQPAIAPVSGAVSVYNLDEIPDPIDVCSGDGGDQTGCTNCPCLNNAPAMTVGGCLNSSGNSARLIATGDPSVTLDVAATTDLRFSLTGAPPLSFTILNSGDRAAPATFANPCFGLESGVQATAFDGLRCAVINTRRHGGRSADIFGTVGFTNSPWGGEGGPPAGIAIAGGGFSAGQSRYFQVINRDDPLAVCQRGLNTSQAVKITFAP